MVCKKFLVSLVLNDLLEIITLKQTKHKDTTSKYSMRVFNVVTMCVSSLGMVFVYVLELYGFMWEFEKCGFVCVCTV